jgi:type VI secretion system secreted protein VgrG
MPTYTQAERALSVTSPLGPDVLLLQGFSGTESISRLFSYQLDLASENDAITPQDIVGQNVTWSVSQIDQAPRYFNGFVCRFFAGAVDRRGLRAYRAEVVPWPWFLTRTANCRIFQERSTREILETLFGEFGFSDYQFDLKGSYPKREYCVQYRETAFNFVSRLMEYEGIFFFFRHEDGKHTMVMADLVGAYEDCAENLVSYSPGSLAPNHITSWEHQYEFRSGKWSRTDYNFESPPTSGCPANKLLTSTPTMIHLPNAGKYEVFDYPGDYVVKDEGQRVTNVRMEEEEAGFDVVTAGSQCCTFTPCGKFTLEGHDVDAENKEYVITSIRHATTEESYGSSAAGASYGNVFTCIPAPVTFRPPRVTPRPTVLGPQTAVVTGPPGEEIHVDKYGRVKVQFFWDRKGKLDDKSSCWIRVIEQWAGKGWGVVAHPRIGQEVVVDFLEGDPDRPLITGRVYNAEQMPPVPLPAGMVVSGIKSKTHKGKGYNELTFDDTAGKEKVNIHAQHDMSTTVEHDQTTHVKRNRSDSIGVDDSESVGGNQSQTVKKKQTVTVEGQRDVWVKKDQREQVDGTHHITVKGDRNDKVTGAVSLDAKGVQTKVSDQFNVEAAKEVHLKGGQKVVIEAGTELTIMVGGSFVKIDAGGVTVVGAPQVKINSGGAPGSGSPCQVTAPEPPEAAKPPPPDDGP